MAARGHAPQRCIMPAGTCNIAGIDPGRNTAMDNRPGFRIMAGGRLMRVSVDRSFVSCDDDWCPVDVRDVRTGMESQAIIAEATAHDIAELITEQQFRDCVRSVHMNATTTWTDGRPTWGEPLPDDFTITAL